MVLLSFMYQGHNIMLNMKHKKSGWKDRKAEWNFANCDISYVQIDLQVITKSKWPHRQTQNRIQWR